MTNNHLTAIALIAAAATASFSARACAQSQTKITPSANATRLTYSLPVDALQRALLKNSGSTMEKQLATAVEVVQARLRNLPFSHNKPATVTRLGAAEFTVDLPSTQPKQIAAARRVIEMIGTLEIRIVASHDSEGLKLLEERRLLQKWLDEGGRDRVRKNPRAIADYPKRPDSLVRWVAHICRARDNRWPTPLVYIPNFKVASVPLYSIDEWNGGRVPAAMLKAPEPRIIELIALDVQEAGFGAADLNAAATRVTSSAWDDCFGVSYCLVEERARDYSEWSGAHIGHGGGIVLNGELISAPVFRGRIPGRGIIDGQFDEAEAQALAIALQGGVLPAKPTLTSQNPPSGAVPSPSNSPPRNIKSKSKDSRKKDSGK